MRYHHRAIAVALAVLLFAVTKPSTAQIINGSIVGQVMDASGASVSGAEITVTNEGTGITQKSSTDNSGAFSVPNLQAGTYTVSAVHPGFDTFRTTGIQVLAMQSVRVDVSLRIGGVQQTVEVTGEAPLITTDNSTVGATLGAKQISSLPLAQQSIDGLLTLVPGAQQNGTGVQWIATGGAAGYGSSNFTINGTMANDAGNGAPSYSYNLGLISLLPVESMQEFKVEAYNTNAEYSQVATVTMVTKAGSNTFHGTAYEYNQNKSLEANTFVNNANSKPRSPFLRNQFGANLGGPIKRNKAFFFFDYYGNRNHSYATNQLTIPGVAMRNGDFSALCATYTNGICASSSGTQLYNPFTGAPFSNNQIPSSMITSQAQALNALLPAPTQATNAAGVPGGAANYFALIGTTQTVNAYDVRIDYHLSDKDQLFGVYSYNIGSPYGVNLGYTPTYGEATNFGYKTIDYSLVETHTFSPHILNDFRFAWFDHPYIRAGDNLDFNPTSLFPQLPASKNRGIPTMSMSGYTGMFYDYGNGIWGHVEHQEYRDGITWVHNRHTFKFGAQTATYKSFAPTVGGPLGSFSFSGQWTGNKGWPGQPHSQGNAYADFLLGVANTSVVSSVPQLEQVYSNWDTEFYAQDTWQASRRLTMIFGLRYSYQTPWWWQDGYSTYWNQVTNQLALPQDSQTATLPGFGANPAAFAAFSFTTTQALGLPKKYMLADPRDWAPRLGLAYRPFGDTRTVFRAGFGVFYNFNACNEGNRNDAGSPPWSGSSSTYSTLLPGTPTDPYVPDITFSNPFPASLSTGTGVSAHPTIYSMQRNFSEPRVLQWNGTLEHQFTENWAARVTYAGAETNHLQWWGENLNVPLAQIPGVPLQNQVPYQPWSTVSATRFGGDASFQQLQLEATKRLADGFMFQVEYSWTRSLSDVDTNITGEPAIPSKPLLDYSNATGIRKQTLVFNYLYQLPFGRGKRLLPNIAGWADAVLGGWEVTGISSYMTGTPFSVSFTVPASYTGWLGGRSSIVPGVPLYSGRQGGHDIISGVQWFNTAAFTAPVPYTWGDSAKNTLWGPGLWNWDISLGKEFKGPERVRLRVRCDFLDAFNHFNLSNPSSTIAATQYGGLPITTSGKIYSGSGNRVIQVGARLAF